MNRCFVALAVLGLIGVPAGPLHAQSENEIIAELVTRTVDACIGPKALAEEGLEEALAILAAIPAKSCTKACKSAGKSCLKLIKNEQKCGQIFLEGGRKVANAVCPDSFCRSVVKERIKAALAIYLIAGESERVQCSFDEATCHQVCT